MGQSEPVANFVVLRKCRKAAPKAKKIINFHVTWKTIATITQNTTLTGCQTADPESTLIYVGPIPVSKRGTAL
jgi:hypothetical protein